MTDYTVAEVKDAIDAYSVEVDVHGGGTYTAEWDWNEVDYQDEKYNVLILRGEKVPFEVTESDTGGEGHGEYVFIVIKVGDQLFRKEGYYASHYGTDWDGDFEEVETYEKTVTAYRAV